MAVAVTRARRPRPSTHPGKERAMSPPGTGSQASSPATCPTLSCGFARTGHGFPSQYREQLADHVKALLNGG
jgi:hypothetical protein